jgi:hypothetical protein
MGDSGGGFLVKPDGFDHWVLSGVISVSVKQNLGHYCDNVKYASYVDVQKLYEWIHREIEYVNESESK